MLERLIALLDGEDAFLVTVHHLRGSFEELPLVAVDEVGLVLEEGGNLEHFIPWTVVISLNVSFV